MLLVRKWLKSRKLFLNLEKKRALNGTVKKLVIEPENKEMCDSKDILTELHKFYSNLFERKRDVTPDTCKQFLDTINVPKILNEHKEKSNMLITLDELTENLFSMNGGKSPGNDGLTVELYSKHIFYFSRVFIRRSKISHYQAFRKAR